MGANQLVFAFPEPKRRAARRGAGRKARAAHLRQTPHRARPVHRKANPVHITLRAGVRSLRSQQVARLVLGALRDSNRDWFRVVHYSVQDNHVHLIVEAEGRDTLSSGVRRLMVRIARRVNRLLRRRGRFRGRSLARSRFGGLHESLPIFVRPSLPRSSRQCSSGSRSPPSRRSHWSKTMSTPSGAHSSGTFSPIRRIRRSALPACTGPGCAL